MSTPTLLFRTAGVTYGIPLEAVAEVTDGGPPSLIPLVPRDVGGVLNVRGDPLPVLDAGVWLAGTPSRATRHVVVLVRGNQRIGMLVEHVAGIDSRLEELPHAGRESVEVGPIPVRWSTGNGGSVGVVDLELLFARAAELLTTRPEPPPLQPSGGEESCPTAF